LARFFLPAGANSATSAPVVATSAPTPMPVTKRSRPNMVMLVDSAVSAMPIENQA
jgi:hypothetical protein